MNAVGRSFNVLLNCEYPCQTYSTSVMKGYALSQGFMELTTIISKVSNFDVFFIKNKIER